MPIRETLLENILFQKMNLGPSPLFDLFGAGAFRSVAVAVKIGLFDVIGTDNLTSEELSSRLGYDHHAIGILLEFLCSLGYVRKKSDRYENTPLTRKWILKGSETSLKEMFSVWENEVFPFWDRNVENVLKNGSARTSLYQEFDEKHGSWESFNSFEMAIASWLKHGLLSHVKLNPSTRRLLDVGGGHGLYTIMFCEKYPQLTATILDRAESLKVARENIDSRNLGKRIDLKIGDMLSDDYGTGYDVAFLINVIHNFRENDNIKILKKTSDALSPSGSIIIFDDFRGPAISKRTVDFFSLAYLITVGGQCYTLKELERWFEETGFGGTKTALGIPGLVRATKFKARVGDRLG